MNDVEMVNDSAEVRRGPMITVVICTYNRATLLTGLLKTLCAQTLDKKHYEVIVVDNNSTDRTRAVTEAFCRQHENVRYCLEPRQGSSHARNRGVELALGEYVGFCDDDCEVPDNWLTIASEIIEEVSPAVFGAGFFALYHAPKPRWYKDSYGSHSLGETARVLKEETVSGGNSFYRRSLLLSLGGFDPTMGPVGKKFGFGEDIAPQLLLRSRMPQAVIYYDPRLHVYHLVRPEKFSLRWIARWRFAMGYDCYRLFHLGRDAERRNRDLWMQAARTIGLFFIALGVGVIKRDRRQYPYFQNYFYERASEYLTDLGRIYARKRLSPILTLTKISTTKIARRQSGPED
jgi:glycosyltransferase involved in cell wall biosynthesis